MTVVVTAESLEAGPGQHTVGPLEMSLLRNACQYHADTTKRSQQWQVKDWTYRTYMATGKSQQDEIRSVKWRNAAVFVET